MFRDIGPIFKESKKMYCLTLDDGTDRSSRNNDKYEACPESKDTSRVGR